MDIARRGAGDAIRARAARWLWAMLAVWVVSALALLALRTDLRHVLASTPGWIAPACMALASVGFALRTWRWLLLARVARIAAAPATLAGIYVGGFPMNLTPARLGELWRSWVLWRGARQGYRRTLPLLVCDRLLDLFALLLLAAFGLAPSVGLDRLALPCLLAAGALAALTLLPGWARRAIKAAWAATGRRRPRLFASLLSVCRNLALLLAPATIVRVLPLSLCAWSAEALALHLLMPAVGGELPLPAAFASLAFANLAGALSLLPGGVGSQELALTLLIAGTAGNSTDAALAMVAILRVGTLWYSAALGLPFFLYFSRAATAAPGKPVRSGDR